MKRNDRIQTVGTWDFDQKMFVRLSRSMCIVQTLLQNYYNISDQFNDQELCTK